MCSFSQLCRFDFICYAVLLFGRFSPPPPSLPPVRRPPVSGQHLQSRFANGILTNSLERSGAGNGPVSVFLSATSRPEICGVSRPDSSRADRAAAGWRGRGTGAGAAAVSLSLCVASSALPTAWLSPPSPCVCVPCGAVRTSSAGSSDLEQSGGLRRAVSLSDLTDANTPRRLLPSTPVGTSRNLTPPAPLPRLLPLPDTAACCPPRRPVRVHSHVRRPHSLTPRHCRLLPSTPAGTSRNLTSPGTAACCPPRRPVRLVISLPDTAACSPPRRPVRLVISRPPASLPPRHCRLLPSTPAGTSRNLTPPASLPRPHSPASLPACRRSLKSLTALSCHTAEPPHTSSCHIPPAATHPHTASLPGVTAQAPASWSRYFAVVPLHGVNE